ncbi:MAG: hypothetical protein ACLS8R_04330 [Anaeromassilibacillus sp.]
MDDDFRQNLIDAKDKRNFPLVDEAENKKVAETEKRKEAKKARRVPHPRCNGNQDARTYMAAESLEEKAKRWA